MDKKIFVLMVDREKIQELDIRHLNRSAALEKNIYKEKVQQEESKFLNPQ